MQDFIPSPGRVVALDQYDLAILADISLPMYAEWPMQSKTIPGEKKHKDGRPSNEVAGRPKVSPGEVIDACLYVLDEAVSFQTAALSDDPTRLSDPASARLFASLLAAVQVHREGVRAIQKQCLVAIHIPAIERIYTKIRDEVIDSTEAERLLRRELYEFLDGPAAERRFKRLIVTKKQIVELLGPIKAAAHFGGAFFGIGKTTVREYEKQFLDTKISFGRQKALKTLDGIEVIDGDDTPDKSDERLVRVVLEKMGLASTEADDLVGRYATYRAAREASDLDVN